jgi:hypothetical protein
MRIKIELDWDGTYSGWVRFNGFSAYWSRLPMYQSESRLPGDPWFERRGRGHYWLGNLQILWDTPKSKSEAAVGA